MAGLGHRAGRIVKAAVACGLVLLSCAPVQAMTQSDLLVAARALGFMEKPPTGTVAVGIVYSESVSQSAAGATALQKLLGAGLKVGNLTLKPVLVRVEELPNATIGMFFLTQGMDGQADKIVAAISSKRIPCITADLEQVRKGFCVIGVRSTPKVEILVNRDAATISGTSFPAVFRMMITEY